MLIEGMPPLNIGNKEARLPIVQGGMGIGISLANLASAVANAGGIGVISAAGIGMFDKKTEISSEHVVAALENEIRKARSMTDGILGVNIMVALTDYALLVQAAIKENIDIIFAGAGLPLNLPKFLVAKSMTKLVPIISSGRAAKLIARYWLDHYQYAPDAFVLEGPKAGGHLGFKTEQINDPSYALERLLPEVLASIAPIEEETGRKIPVIAAGGIYTGADIEYYLTHGASGVQMATRFVTTNECDASDVFKQTYINAREEDIVIINSPVGMPGRAIFNPFLEAVCNGLKHPFACPYNCIVTCKKENAPYCISLALYHAKNGKMQYGFAFAGSNAYRAESIISVKELIALLLAEYNAAQAACLDLLSV